MITLASGLRNATATVIPYNGAPGLKALSTASSALSETWSEISRRFPRA